jgi:hypothetical protein
MSIESRSNRPSLFTAGAVMLLLSLLLFWLPILGPLVAGFIGGRMTRSPGRGLALAVLPAVAIGIVVRWS